MNMSNSDRGSSEISPDDWERIARYLTGEASSAETEATKRWVEADPHRVEMVRLLESVLANVSREVSPDIDVEVALKDVKSRLHESKVIPLAPRMEQESRRTFAAFLRVAAAALIIVGG